jgi:hypothetical protein
VAGAITPGEQIRSRRVNQDCIQVHQAMIYDRGGVRRLWQLVDVAEVEWNRELDGLSTAQITVTGEACVAQADVLGRIEPRRHELVLFRNGDRVWEGPIVQVAWFRDRATLLAHDVLEYLKYTALSKAWPNEDGGGPPLMLDRTREILEYELTTPYVMSVGTGTATHDVTVPRWESLDPPANVLPHLEVRSGEVLTRSVTEAFEMTVFEHVQNLARGGMDYTVIGRKILFWDRKDTIGRTRTLTDNDFYGEIEIFAAGSDHWSIEHVVAQPSDVPAEYEPEPEAEEGEEEGPDLGTPLAVGNAGGEDPFYGVWTHITTSENEEGTSEPTQNELNSQAGRGLVGRTPVPVEIRVPSGGGIRPSFDLTIADLIPGAEAPVLATLNLRRISQMQRIESVTVTETSESEEVGVKMVPYGDVTGVDTL